MKRSSYDTTTTTTTTNNNQQLRISGLKKLKFYHNDNQLYNRNNLTYFSDEEGEEEETYDLESQSQSIYKPQNEGISITLLILFNHI